MAADFSEDSVKLERARQFGALARGREAAVRLDLCCLLIGRIVEPQLDPLAALQRLDELADAVRSPDPGQPLPDRVERLCRVLFEEHHFRGDTETYYEPINCCLHAALASGRGMPITLAAVMLEVGRRTGIELHGVGAPFHFLVKYSDNGRERYLDPFHAGREIEREALAERLRATNFGAGPNPESFLAAVTKRQILQRILTNLKGACVRKRDYAAAIEATDYLLALSPWSLEDRRDRGLLCYQTGQYIEALDDLQQYQQHAADAPDAGRVAAIVERVRVRLGVED